MRAILVSALLLFNMPASFAIGDSPLVFDAQGKFVGPLEDYGGPGVYLTISGAVAFAYIDRVTISGDGGPQTVYSATEFRWTSATAVSYTSSDCSGTPIITVITGVRPALAIRQGADVTLYIAAATNSGPMSAGSIRSGPNFACTTSGTPTTNYGWPTEISYSLTGAYKEPLSIRFPLNGADQRWH